MTGRPRDSPDVHDASTRTPGNMTMGRRATIGIRVRWPAIRVLQPSQEAFADVLLSGEKLLRESYRGRFSRSAMNKPGASGSAALDKIEALHLRTGYGWFNLSAWSIFTVTLAPSVTVTCFPRTPSCRANSGSAYSTCASAGQANKR
jgi:hypothetical protein